MLMIRSDVSVCLAPPMAFQVWSNTSKSTSSDYVLLILSVIYTICAVGIAVVVYRAINVEVEV